MFAKIAVLALLSVCLVSNSEAYYVAAPAYAAAYPSVYTSAYSPYYYGGAYSGYAAAYPTYAWGWGSNKNAEEKGATPTAGASLTNNQ